MNPDWRVNRQTGRNAKRKKTADIRHVQHADAENRQRYHRFLRPCFDPEEQQKKYGRCCEQPHNQWGTPWMVGPAALQRIQERGKGNRKGERAEVIDFFGPAFDRLVQKYDDQNQRGGADRHVDVENPAP